MEKRKEQINLKTNLKDIQINIKTLCHSILEDILKNIENELFNYEQDIFYDYVNNSKDKIEFNKNLFIQELDKLLEKNHYDNYNYTFIKTNQKFLEKIKKDEMNMNNEYRRREKVRKIENEKRFNMYLNKHLIIETEFLKFYVNMFLKLFL